MIGTYVNVGAIVAGTVLGRVMKRPLPAGSQSVFKNALGALIVFFGLREVWLGLNGTFAHVTRQLAVVVLSLILGRILGRVLRLQKNSNRLGRFARERMAAARPDAANRFTSGFAVCSALFCAAPMGMIGAMQDGLSGDVAPLAVKAAMDALAAMSFVGMFGWGVALSAVPVLILQGTISLCCARLALPFLAAHQLLDSASVTGGFLISWVALIIFEIRKIEVTDYLPSLVIAPLLTWWWLR